MKWKIFLTVLTSAAFSVFPENMIGCGPTEDPSDYYTRFFNREMAAKKGLEPFIYSSLCQFFENYPAPIDSMNASESDLMKEWVTYSGNQVSASAVYALVQETSVKELQQLQGYLKTGQALPATFGVSKNALAKYLFKTKNAGVTDYLILNKRSDPLSVKDDWEPRGSKDSLTANALITQTQASLKTAKDQFLKDRYGYLLCKLAFYNNRHNDCVKWYNESFGNGTSKSLVEVYAHSYMAGSLFRLNRDKEAAYEFSKLFDAKGVDRQQVYTGFSWATHYSDAGLEESYAAMGKTPKEKANIHALFALYGTDYRLGSLKKVYSLDKDNSLLPMLATREINKIEERYLTPSLAKEEGGKQYYYSWIENEDLSKDKKQIAPYIDFFKELATSDNANGKAFYLTASAYLNFIRKDYAASKKLISEARSSNPDEDLKDQLEMINLLVIANESSKLDAATEAAILPSLKQLALTAGNNGEYRIFLRNFMSEILAQRYEQQNEKYKAALAYSFADARAEYWTAGLDYIRSEVETSDLIKLYEIYTGKTNTPYVDFLLSDASVTKDDVVNMIGTSYLRDYKFEKAIEWLKKSSKQDKLVATYWNEKTQKEVSVNVDPFFDYVNDWERYMKPSAIAYTPLLLAEKLLETEKAIGVTKDSAAKSKLYYKMGNGLYNMSHYGNSYEAVTYYRRSSAWNEGNYKTQWEKEFYGVISARNYFQKAYDLATNQEFKAACYFLVIKCDQRQIVAPDDVSYASEDDKGYKSFIKKFTGNPLFANFQKEFGKTKYYNYVYNRCSYLRDFVKKG